MIDHVSIAVRDLTLSTGFYDQVLATIGYRKLVTGDKAVGFGRKYPEFWLNSRPGMARIGKETGAHVCLRVKARAGVDAFFAAAIAAGAQDNGPPGRREYAENYYAAFIRDRDGNAIEVLSFLD